jgi:uncharacterized protein (DUF2062 family)
MLPLVVISLMAIGLYYSVRGIDFSELGRSALFDVVMLCVALGIAGLFGVVGAWVRSNGDDAGEGEGFCFVGALIGAVVFYVALFSWTRRRSPLLRIRQSARLRRKQSAGCARTVSTDRHSPD